MVEHLLFAGEFQLTDPVSGTSDFASQFAERGLQTPSGKSLRQFNLKTRLFQYPCSYVIDTPLFAQLPTELKQPVIEKLLRTLQDRTQPKRIHGLLNRCVKRSSRSSSTTTLSSSQQQQQQQRLAIRRQHEVKIQNVYLVMVKNQSYNE